MSLPKPTDLVETSHANWMRLHPLLREDCLNVLRDEVPLQTIEGWRAAYQKSGSFSDCPFFHLYEGMCVRNILRQALLDEELPDVDYGNGVNARNWDDFYLGAMKDLILL